METEATAVTPPETSRPIRDEQVRLLFRFSVVGYLATLLVVFILGAVLWDQLSKPLLFAWFAAISVITTARYALYKVFIARDPAPAELPVWEKRFLAGSIATALCWAAIATPLLLPEAAQTGPRMTVVMLVTLLVTGSIGYYAPHAYAFKLTAFIGLVPFALTLGFSGDRVQMFLSGAILLLAGVLPYVHEKLYLALVDSLAVRRAKAALSSELETERTNLQRANEALAAEMAERLKAQQEQLLAAQKLRLHVERTPLAVIEWDAERRVSAWNPAAEAIFGFGEKEALGRAATELIVPAQGSGALEAMWGEIAHTHGGNKLLLDNVTRSGREIQCEWYNTPLVDPQGRVLGFASLVQDVTERINTERTIHYMAHHDALTGLPNRRLMQDRLNQAIMHARRHQRHVGVLFLDLDRFKLLNDTLGHDSGDFILKDVAKRLLACVREGDTVSREGGDEFVVILPDLERPENASIVAEKIVREFARPIEINGQEIHLTTSIGISHYPNDAADVNHLLKHADSAMYQAKDAGRNTVRYFTSDLNFLLSRRLEVEGKLRKAIDNGEFFLRYQPQVDLASGRITGMESLLRWEDPAKGEILPGDFVHIAEELGLIVRIGEWVFQTACHQLKAWEAAGFRDITLSVNISPRQFMSAKLVPTLLAAVRESGANPQRLEIEITETMAMRNLEQSIDILRQIREAGIGVAIDDFGVGYSSLAQLARLPASSMKIDRSFVASVPGEETSTSITEAIIAMAKRLRLRVIAEGVETTAQLQFLRTNQCDAFQGYLFARPLRHEEATAMLQSNAREVPPAAAAG